MKEIFQAGDEVVFHEFGKKIRGKIVSIDSNEPIYPVVCHLETGGVYTFTVDGKRLSDDPIPCLSFPDGGWNYGTPPERSEREPEPLKFDGTPKWAWVGDRPDSWKAKARRLIVASNGKRYTGISYGKTNTESVDVVSWAFAWEIPEEEEEME